jgi:hypothetical protein
VCIALPVAAAGWWLGRDSLVLALGRGSVGAPGRTELIAAAINRLHPDFPVNMWLASQQPALVSSLHPSSGVGWIVPAGAGLVERRVFADGDLRFRGFLSSSRLYGWPGEPPGDHDGDGRLEVTQLVEVVRAGTVERAIGVIRIGEGGEQNQLLAAVVFKPSRQWTHGVRWQDLDLDGMDELTVVRKPFRAAAFRLKPPPEVVAVFKWTERGGGLRAERIPEDGLVGFWLPSTSPHGFAPEMNLETVIFP